MKIIVLVKCVPDTETRMRIAPDGRSMDESDVKWIVSPFDEFALEEALRIVEKRGQGSVVVLTLGDDRSQPVLRQCLAMGAERAVLLGDPAFQGSDGLATARALAAACRKIGFDLVLAGKQGVGHDRSQVGPMVAELLDIPHVGVVTKLDLGEGKATAHREIEGGSEVVEIALPALVTAQKGLNEPRYANLKGIMAAKKKPIDVWGPAEIGLGADEVGVKASAETWTKLELPPARPPVKMLKGDATTVAKDLVRLLAEEAKVI